MIQDVTNVIFFAILFMLMHKIKMFLSVCAALYSSYSMIYNSCYSVI